MHGAPRSVLRLAKGDWIRSAVWTPDAKRVFFVRFLATDSRAGNDALETFPVSGGGPTVVFTAPQGQVIRLYGTAGALGTTPRGHRPTWPSGGRQQSLGDPGQRRRRDCCRVHPGGAPTGEKGNAYSDYPVGRRAGGAAHRQASSWTLHVAAFDVPDRLGSTPHGDSP